ncbi:unnamed protein product [Soboliphyme baturini]|uniref:DNA-directed RNA polymerase n=1 Tax=Soboliphyme baturini TaxID=241478 RepID=A0A183IH96_9BILA|nr:unnamed protein product [Soboliphyme baturini]
MHQNRTGSWSKRSEIGIYPQSDGKEQQYAGEAKRRQLVQGLSNTKRQGSGILNLVGWKLFYSSVDITTRAQAGVGVLVESNLVDRITEWNFINRRAAIIRQKPQQANALTLLKVNAPNLEGEYTFFREDVEGTLFEMPTAESVIVMDDLNTYVGGVSESGMA